MVCVGVLLSEWNNKQFTVLVKILYNLNHCVVIVGRDVIVLFQSYGDMRVFVTGKEETDELLCK